MTDSTSEAGHRAMNRLYVLSGYVTAALTSWLLSEIVTMIPLVFYFAMAAVGLFVVVAVVDTWRLR